MSNLVADKKPKVKPHTLKQRLFVREYLKTGNATEAAMKTYDVKNRFVATRMGSENLLKLDIMPIMNKMGLTDAKLLEVLEEGLKANKIHGTDDNFVEIADHATRHRFMETGFKLRGRLNDATIGLPDKVALVFNMYPKGK